MLLLRARDGSGKTAVEWTDWIFFVSRFTYDIDCAGV